MPTVPNTPLPGNDEGSLGDVQRALALLIIGCLVLATSTLIIRMSISADMDDVVDITKIMLAALVNMGLVALGFFYGSNKSKQTADATQANLIDKLTPTPPVAPTPTAPVTPWWGRLTDPERAAIAAAAPSEPQAAAFMTAAQIGAATPTDLAYLVTRGLLTQDRATAIST